MIQSALAMTTSERDGDEPADLPARDDDSKLDAFIGGVIERHPYLAGDEHEEKRKPGGNPDMRGERLDKQLAVNFAKDEAQQAEVAAMDRARPDYEELAYRNGPDLNQQVASLRQWADWWRENPTATTDMVQRQYQQISPYGLREPPKVERAGKDDPLSDLISDAQSKAEAPITLSSESKKTLDDLFPNRSRDEQLQLMNRIEKDLIRDPEKTARTIGAALGLPVTEAQRYEAQQHAQYTAAVIQDMAGHIAAAEQFLPGFTAIKETIAEVLLRPDVVYSGNARDDIARAYAIVRAAAPYAAANNMTIAQVLDWNQKKVAEQRVQQRVQSTIAEFSRAIGPDRLNAVRHDMGDLLEKGKASSIGEAYEKATQARVAKARRAAPVRSSGTLPSSRGGGSLDDMLDAGLRAVGY